MSHIFQKLKLCSTKHHLSRQFNNLLFKYNKNVQINCNRPITKYNKINTINLHNRQITAFCRKYVTSNTIDEGLIEELVDTQETIGDITDKLEDKDTLRFFVYQNDNFNNDVVMKQLFNSTTVQDVFICIKNNEYEIKHHHVCQSILTLLDLQKAYRKCYLLNLDKVDVNLEEMESNYINQIKSHPDFDILLNLVDKHAPYFNPLELSCTLFNLKKMDLSIDHPLIDKLINLSHCSIKDNINRWCLKSLCMFCSSFEAKDNLRSVYLTKDILPHYLKTMKNCNSPEELEYLTIGLYNMHILISRTVLNEYINKVKEVFDKQIIEREHLKLLVKVLVFLNLPHWSRDNSQDIQYFLSLFKDRVDQLNVGELVILHSTCYIQNSAGYLRESIKDRATYFLNEYKNDNRMWVFMKLPNLIFCQVTASSLDSKSLVEKTIEDCLQNAFPSMLTIIYRLLKHLKYSESKISEAFWSKVLELSVRENAPDYVLLRLMYRYMYFNNNLGNSYRHLEFEKAIFDKCGHLRDSYIFHIPWKLSRIVAFLIAYGFDRRHSIAFEIFHDLISRLEEMKDQLSPLDLLILGRGLNLAKFQSHLNSSNKRDMVLLRLDRMLNHATANLLNNQHSKLDDLCCILKSCQYRKTRYESEEFYNIICKLEKSEGTLSSSRIREVLLNLYPSGVLLPKLFKKICEFVADDGHNLFGEILHRVLYIFYYLGYTPQNEKFYSTVLGVIERDKNVMNCLSILQLSIALCHFGQLPESLVRYVFSIDFMEKIDKEVESCYLKLKYPMRIRQNLMLLNRAVCLELPQYDVPWFHEKYLQGKQSSIPYTKSVIHDDVLNILVQVLGSQNAICRQHFSPYGYKIDFFAQLDKKNKPILQTATSVKNIVKTKIAISLINSKTFSKYCDTSDDDILRFKLIPNGILSSRKRHLELMGYRVIDIHPSLWNSMQMAEPNEKFKYLHKGMFNTL